MVAERFAANGLTLHPTKTRRVAFHRPDQAVERPATFDLLGFTLYWARSRRGFWVVKYRTANDRFSRALRRIREWCRGHLHWSLEAQRRMLAAKLQGHYAYYGVTSNFVGIRRFYEQVRRIWRQWLSRRSQKGRVSWPAMARILQVLPLPKPTIVHRFGA